MFKLDCSDKKQRISIVLVVVFSMVLFYLGVMTRYTCDYLVAHTHSLEVLPVKPLINPLNWLDWLTTRPYFLWPLTGHVLMKIFRLSADYAAGINTGAWLALTYISVLALMRYLLRKYEIDTNAVIVLSFLAFIVAPVWLPWRNEFIIYPVGGMNILHNAPNICGRCVGIWALFIIMKLLDKIIEQDYRPTIKDWIASSGLLLLSLFAKPSFAQVFAPAFGLMIVYLLIRYKGRFVKNFLFWISVAIIPAIWLFYSFFHYFGDSGTYTERTGTGFVIGLPDADTLRFFCGNIILVFLFPFIMFLIVIIIGRFDRWHMIVSLMLVVSWLMLLCFGGSAEGEMWWANYVASFLFFLIAIKDYIEFFWMENDIVLKRKSLLFTVLTAALTEHSFTGIVYIYKLIFEGQIMF